MSLICDMVFIFFLILKTSSLNIVKLIYTDNQFLFVGPFPLRSYYSTHASIHGPVGPDGLPLEVDWRKHGVVTDVVNQVD